MIPENIMLYNHPSNRTRHLATFLTAKLSYHTYGKKVAAYLLGNVQSILHRHQHTSNNLFLRDMLSICLNTSKKVI